MELIKEKEPTQLKYPVDWEILNLGKSSVLKARIGWQGLTTAEYLDAGDYYLITGTDFKHGYIDWDNCVYVEKLRYDQDKNIQVKEDDVLVTKDGTIGKVAFVNNVPKKTTLNSGVFVIRPVHKSYYPRYFYYVLMSEHFKDFLGKLTAGSTISHLYQKDFVHYEFPLPPTLTEQKAIATALSDVDALIASLEQTITKKKAIKQGAMQQLLTPPHKGGERLPGFSGEWVEKTFEEIFVRKNSKSHQIQSRDYQEFGLVPVIDQGKTKIVAYSDKVNKKYKVSDKNPIIVFGDHTRELKFIDFSFVVGADGTQLLDTNNEFSTRLMFEFLNTKEIPNTGYNRHFKFLKELIFIVPESLKEQKAIAQILSDMDAEITQLESKKEKYQAIKQGMMQELLTGKTRLK
jgi:type I restriction enzyme S subunit